MDNLKEMDRLLEKFKPSKTEPGRNGKSITSTETDTVIKNLPRKQSPGSDDFTGEFHLEKH